MKTIYLLRHADALPKTCYQKDIERKLSETGKTEAKLIAQQLLKEDIMFDSIISSSATRTKETISIIQKHLNFIDSKLTFVDSAYNSSTKNLIDIVNTFNSSINSVLLIGHNPSISLLANYLTDNEIYHFPTCGIIRIDLDIDNWKEIIKGVGLEKFFFYPEMF